MHEEKLNNESFVLEYLYLEDYPVIIPEASNDDEQEDTRGVVTVDIFEQ